MRVVKLTVRLDGQSIDGTLWPHGEKSQCATFNFQQ